MKKFIIFLLFILSFYFFGCEFILDSIKDNQSTNDYYDDEENEEAVVFCVNRSLDEKVELDISLLGFEGYRAIEFSSMDGYDVKKENTFDKEEVKMHLNPLPQSDGKVTTAELKPLSFNVIRFKKA